MATSGLDTLFQNLGPATASMVAGERDYQAQQEAKMQALIEQERLKALQQTYNQNERINPIEVQHKTLINQGLEAENPGKVADATLKQITSRVAAAGEGDTIAMNAAKTKSELLALKLKEHQAYDGVLGDLAPKLASVPDAAKHSFITSYLQSTGVDMEAPYVKNMLQKFATMKPQDILPAMTKEKEWAARVTPGYIQHMEGIKAQGSNHLEGIRLQTASQERIAQAKLQAATAAKVKAYKDMDQILREAKNPQAKAEALDNIYYEAIKNQADEETLARIKARAEDARKRAAEDAANRANGAPGSILGTGPDGKPAIVPKPAPTATAPIAGTPKLGTAENPIVLK